MHSFVNHLIIVLLQAEKALPKWEVEDAGAGWGRGPNP